MHECEIRYTVRKKVKVKYYNRLNAHNARLMALNLQNREFAYDQDLYDDSVAVEVSDDWYLFGVNGDLWSHNESYHLR